ncbi:MAG: DUF763 domain-containing protein [Thermoplasmata archaeon]
MQRIGSAVLPLHYGHPPEKLFRRMIQLSGILSTLIVEKFGTDQLLEKLSDPFWFHSFSLAIGFDWNSSGTTTATMAALKEYSNRNDSSFKILGGKGEKMSSVRPEAMNSVASGFINESKIYNILDSAKTIAKVDQKLLQDSYDLYMHFIVLDDKSRWAIIQQGMNQETRLARRYHWLYKTASNMIDDSRAGISAVKREESVLDLSTRQSDENRRDMLELVRDDPMRYRHLFGDRKQMTLFPEKEKVLDLNHRVDWNKLREIYEYAPSDFGELFMMHGVGNSTIRAISYLAEIVFGSEPSFKDPLKFSFALGGKDGIPKPVNYDDYDKCLSFYSDVLSDFRIGSEKSMIMVKNLARAGFRLSSP